MTPLWTQAVSLLSVAWNQISGVTVLYDVSSIFLPEPLSLTNQKARGITSS